MSKHGNSGKKKKPDHPALLYFEKADEDGVGVMTCKIKLVLDDANEEEKVCGEKITVAELGEKTAGWVYIYYFYSLPSPPLDKGCVQTICYFSFFGRIHLKKMRKREKKRNKRKRTKLRKIQRGEYYWERGEKINLITISAFGNTVRTLKKGREFLLFT